MEDDGAAGLEQRVVGRATSSMRAPRRERVEAAASTAATTAGLASGSSANQSRA
jgi:hypothetical protein